MRSTVFSDPNVGLAREDARSDHAILFAQSRWSSVFMLGLSAMHQTLPSWERLDILAQHIPGVPWSIGRNRLLAFEKNTYVF